MPEGAEKGVVGSTPAGNQGTAAAAGSAKTTTRVTTTIDSDTYERLKYWSDRHGISINEYLKEALELKIRHENKDFEVPSLLIQRVNQLIDAVNTLSSNSKALEHITVSGFESLLGLTKGENYLLDDTETGEL